jgi:predicted HicB family RNase H-like nuclease
MVERKREKLLNVRLLESETDMLAELAEREGVTVSEWIRNVIRVQHALLPAKPSKRSKRK